MLFRSLSSGELAGAAMLNTHISAAVAALVWTGIEWVSRGKPSVLGVLTGAVAGLGMITPAAGYVEPWAAMLIGVALGVAFYLNKTPLPFVGAKPANPPAGAPAEGAKGVAGMPQGTAKDAGKDKPKFDFYKILPGGEEPVTEREIKDAAKAAKGQPEAARGIFFIQAGSFQNPADADNQKARIAILGFESSVEPTSSRPSWRGTRYSSPLLTTRWSGGFGNR